MWNEPLWYFIVVEEQEKALDRVVVKARNAVGGVESVQRLYNYEQQMIRWVHDRMKNRKERRDREQKIHLVARNKTGRNRDAGNSTEREL